MTALQPPSVRALYDSDYLQWIATTVQQLQQGDYAQVDWANLIEEIADMGRRERQSLESNLTVLLLHLLKWRYQPSHRTRSWLGSIVEHRRRIHKAFRDSPSLKLYFEKVLGEAYTDAVAQAVVETGLSKGMFPGELEFSPAQIMDESFPPEISQD
ncbi:MAG: DUF29 domain-containing protein [Cyanobacteria bacterium P01_A01_bin.105]